MKLPIGICPRCGSDNTDECDYEWFWENEDETSGDDISQAEFCHDCKAKWVIGEPDQVLPDTT